VVAILEKVVAILKKSARYSISDMKYLSSCLVRIPATHIATHCNTLQYTATQLILENISILRYVTPQLTMQNP